MAMLDPLIATALTQQLCIPMAGPPTPAALTPKSRITVVEPLTPAALTPKSRITVVEPLTPAALTPRSRIAVPGVPLMVAVNRTPVEAVNTTRSCLIQGMATSANDLRPARVQVSHRRCRAISSSAAMKIAVEANAAEPNRLCRLALSGPRRGAPFRQKVSKMEQMAPLRQCYAAVSVWAAFGRIEGCDTRVDDPHF
jgi:hypothetical protein